MVALTRRGSVNIVVERGRAAFAMMEFEREVTLVLALQENRADA